MIASYTLARVHPTRDKKVYRAVKTFKEVIITYGEYDLIVKVESNSLEDLDDFIFNKLRSINGVTTTTTLLEANPKQFS